MDLKYGQQKLTYNIPEHNIEKIVRPREKEGLDAPQQEVASSLKNPDQGPPLNVLLEEKCPEDILIIVNDVSRPTPYDIMLPPLLEFLAHRGYHREDITFLVATGTHKPHTESQNREVLGPKITEEYRVISHRADRKDELIKTGTTSSGNRITLNKLVINTDFVITTGVILPHYFAGFSGGRKSIMPGVAGRKCIEKNHSRMVELIEGLPPLEENPIHREMMEAVEIIELDFIINVVTNSRREIVQVVCGDYHKAWLKGVQTSEEMYYVKLPEKVDAAVVSAGGYPRDINLYQAQKALDHADQVVKEQGTIILAAECEDGLGEETFARWMEEASHPEKNIERIGEKFVLGGHKAFAVSKVVHNKELILISSLSPGQTEDLFARKETNLQQAVDYLREKHGPDYRAVLMPEGSLTVPVIKN